VIGCFGRRRINMFHFSIRGTLCPVVVELFFLLIDNIFFFGMHEDLLLPMTEVRYEKR
jgi:hypothetical protein